MKKPYAHICANCFFFAHDVGLCVNCDSPGDVRKKMAEDVCDGGGCGADYCGFKPKEKED